MITRPLHYLLTTLLLVSIAFASGLNGFHETEHFPTHAASAVVSHDHQGEESRDSHEEQSSDGCHDCLALSFLTAVAQKAPQLGNLSDSSTLCLQKPGCCSRRNTSYFYSRAPPATT